VGQGNVWIDTKLGRLGLSAAQMRSVERVGHEGPSMPRSTKYAIGEFVRARTPGGPIYGKIVAVDGERVTLVMDQGGKIMLESPVLEPVKSRAVVKRP
jgi:hypothetical protein